jgi:hypothetical protein
LTGAGVTALAQSVVLFTADADAAGDGVVNIDPPQS